MDYIRYHITTQNTATAEIILAFLSELPFDTFQEKEEGLEAFIPVHLHNQEIEQQVADVVERFAAVGYQKENIPSQNWNKVWESNFQPVLIEGFCGVRADFHPLFDDVEHEIIINPRMAFGTGHHATTYTVMELMQNLNFEGQSVLDYGCGTGILSILAAKMGCTDVDAVDIEQASYDNTIENATYNGVGEDICTYHGTLKDVPLQDYDIVLANINRNVILQSLPALHRRLVPGGVLLTSGYLLADQAVIEAALLEAGFLPTAFVHKGNWVAGKAYRRY